MKIRLQFEDDRKRWTDCDYKKGLRMKRKNQSFFLSKQICPKGLARVSSLDLADNFLDNE